MGKRSDKRFTGRMTELDVVLADCVADNVDTAILSENKLSSGMGRG